MKNILERIRTKIKKPLAARLLIFLITSFLITFYIIAVNIPSAVGKPNPIMKDEVINKPSESNNQDEIESQEISIIFAGDIMLARTIGQNILRGVDPFQYVKETFDKYDLVIGNLETTIAPNNIGFPATKGYTFKAPIESINTLKTAGFDAVSLANNHSMDYFGEALKYQIKELEASGITTFGSGNNVSEAFEPKYLLFQNTKIALLGFNDVENWVTDATQSTPGSANFNEVKIKEAVKKAAQNSDIVVVMPHWGEEYVFTHNQRQEYFAKLFIDSGADIVVGAHPHVIQDFQEYKGKKIYYSLGNFVFDWMGAIPGATSGHLLEVIIKNREISSTKTINISIDQFGFPSIDN